MRNKKLSKLLGLILAMVLLFPSQSCDNDNNIVIPYVYVDLSIDLNILNQLAVPGNSMLFPEFGFGGVYVYCEYFNSMAPAQSIYHAFDAACTYETTPASTEVECILSNEENTLIVTCPCCGSQFSLMDGFIATGPATKPLQVYRVSILGNKLEVSN